MSKKENYEFKDVKFEADDFKLCQNDTKIFDTKFDTKPTTFLKDALKRFRKNRSSVVGAFIIGILLLLSVAVPIVSPYTTTSSSSEYLLNPKLFSAGTGFWDGTIKVNKVIYNSSTQSTSYNELGIVDGSMVLSSEGDYFIDTVTSGAYGGDLVLVNTNKINEDTIRSQAELDNPNMTAAQLDAEVERLIDEASVEKMVYFKNYHGISFSSSDNFTLDINAIMPTGDTLETLNSKYGVLATYSVTMEYKTASDSSEVFTVDIMEDNEEYFNHSISSTTILSNLGLSSIYDAKFSVNINAEVSGKCYTIFDYIGFTAIDVSDEVLTSLNNYSLTDVNNSLLVSANADGTFPANYWVSTASKYVSQANVIYASFVYDRYQEIYGDYSANITVSQIETYVANGWMTYDFDAVDPASTFVVLSEKCPIVEVTSHEGGYHPLLGDTTIITGVVTGYKILGYDSAPRFLFGTNDQGIDLVTSVFSGLKISLLIAISASLICFSIGIIWGAISGYYGGNIDLYMERFCDILGGIPWIVLMTLTILLLGNNILTFMLALCLTGWMGIAKRTRTQFYRFKGREYVLASRTLGANDKRLIFRHILPNGMGTIITSSILMIPSVIFSEATISYLGLGLQGENTLGVILSANQKYLQSYPALILFPAIIISLIMISFNLFGNGLRDAFNPSLKGSE